MITGHPAYSLRNQATLCNTAAATSTKAARVVGRRVLETRDCDCGHFSQWNVIAKVLENKFASTPTAPGHADTLSFAPGVRLTGLIVSPGARSAVPPVEILLPEKLNEKDYLTWPVRSDGAGHYARCQRGTCAAARRRSAGRAAAVACGACRSAGAAARECRARATGAATWRFRCAVAARNPQ
jgi:hypothetical protein